MSTFHTQVEYVSLLLMHYENHCKQWARKTPKTSPIGHVDSHLIHNPWDSPTHHPKWKFNHFTYFTQLCNKVPIGYSGMPHIHPKIALCCGAISTSVFLPPPWTQPTHHPKRHPGPISNLSSVHQTDTQTDRQMGRCQNLYQYLIMLC